MAYKEERNKTKKEIQDGPVTCLEGFFGPRPRSNNIPTTPAQLFPLPSTRGFTLIFQDTPNE